jgi:hypothetical protein
MKRTRTYLVTPICGFRRGLGKRKMLRHIFPR